MMTVIVMLSTYNGKEYLEEQLESIFSQKTSARIRLIVRDDGSSDGTEKIIYDWREQHDIEVIDDGLSLGPAKSFWKLLNTVDDADYYAFVDQDDRWDDRKIQTAIDEIGNEGSPILWFSNCRLIDGNGAIVKKQKKTENDVPVLSMESELICGSAQGCSMVFNRAALETIKKYPIKEIPMHDIVLMEYMIALGKVIYHKEPLFSYRAHEKNVVANQGKSMMRRIRASLKAWLISNKNSYQRFSEELLNNIGQQLSEETRDYLFKLASCKQSFASRIAIISDPRTNHSNWRAIRSFRIRVFLGII